MELNSLLILLEAAEYLERREREAEHGYASVLPFDGDFAREKTKAAGLVRKAPNNRCRAALAPRTQLASGTGEQGRQMARSSHNELEKHREAAPAGLRPVHCCQPRGQGTVEASPSWLLTSRDPLQALVLVRSGGSSQPSLLAVNSPWMAGPIPKAGPESSAEPLLHIP
uniref:max dimerization protein 4 isoform X5 n=1 Tax=Callithrix jacchus TaxID=9483 RepID=UPI0023DD3232|nr:max dimerization protein 4 isoform X5 [Callithrix jacchus]